MRSFFKPSLKLLRGLPDFLWPIFTSPNNSIFGILVGAIRATCPAYLSLASLQKVSTDVIETPLFDVFAQSKLLFVASALVSYNNSMYETLSCQVFPYTVCKNLYYIPSIFLICLAFQFHVSHPEYRTSQRHKKNVLNVAAGNMRLTVLRPRNKRRGGRPVIAH